MTSTFWFFKILFYAAVFLIFYTYVIFPAILHLLYVLKKKSISDVRLNIELPKVSILIAAYNEEKVIREKIESIIQSNYPKQNLEIIVGSDASDDATVSIVNELASKNSFIKLIDYSVRRGKPSVINDLVSQSSHPIIILTDANVFFEREMILKLLANFDNDKVGLAGANILNIGMRKDGISIQEKKYIERENLIKYREGVLWGTMMGPFGGCYALRKNLFERVPADFLVDDFYISMKTIEKGFHCINDLGAICYEDVSNDIRQEYRRKSRISAGNFQNLKTFSKFLLRPFNPAGFCFISHKFFRWITPFFIIISLASLIILSGYNRIYFYMLICEIILLCSPFIDGVAVKAGIHFRLLRFISYFTFMNLALLKGFFRFISGIDSGIWTPTKRT